jgi:hypothetical protein
LASLQPEASLYGFHRRCNAKLRRLKISMLGQMVRFTEEPNALLITLLSTGRKYLKELKRGGDPLESDAVFHELIEHQLCNGWDEVRPEEIGALTSAPIFSPNVQRDEDGELIRVDYVYAYMNYQVFSPALELFTDGHIRLEKA